MNRNEHFCRRLRAAAGWLRRSKDSPEVSELGLQESGVVMVFSHCEGAQNITQRERISLLTPGGDWNLRVDLDRQLKFPPEITTTSLRPDIILWSPSVKAVILAELTVPWEGGMEAAFERKEKYTGLAAECREAGWSTVICLVEVGCRGFIGTSIQCLLRDVGVTGSKLKAVSKDLAKEAERASCG
ncbi:hypothetical protein N1851_007698 [Merluccius polli]|uniref:Uncharacterized protein n=1 Tax=Merluccius polli TaxID=89951 RepID=A0AA47N3M9_MERPO|nr:hypothetical protein N1851_007698 [Merluccius polli]